VAVVLIAASVEIADDLGWIGRVEVDRGWVKVCHFRKFVAFWKESSGNEDELEGVA
jgi:hypothetical protein